MPLRPSVQFVLFFGRIANPTVLNDGIANAAEPETRTPKPETRNPKLETRNPKPETRNPKPETRNPKLFIPGFVLLVDAFEY